MNSLPSLRTKVSLWRGGKRARDTLPTFAKQKSMSWPILSWMGGAVAGAGSGGACQLKNLLPSGRAEGHRLQSKSLPSKQDVRRSSIGSQVDR